MIAELIKVTVALIDAFDLWAVPQIPCPDVQPPPTLAPYPISTEPRQTTGIISHNGATARNES